MTDSAATVDARLDVGTCEMVVDVSPTIDELPIKVAPIIGENINAKEISVSPSASLESLSIAAGPDRPTILVPQFRLCQRRRAMRMRLKFIFVDNWLAE